MPLVGEQVYDVDRTSSVHGESTEMFDTSTDCVYGAWYRGGMGPPRHHRRMIVQSQQAAALLHAAGLTNPHQWIHFHGEDEDAAYTAAVVLLEAAGLSAETEIRELAGGGGYYAARFVTENGSIELTSPEGMPGRESRRMVMTPAANLARCECGMCDSDRVSLTTQGEATLAGLKARVLDLHDPAQRAEFVSNLEARAWRDGDPHDEAAS